MARVFLGLGTNKGDGRAVIAGAADALRARLTGFSLSSLYLSEPMYVIDQPSFLNAAASGDFDGTPYQLLHFINGIEALFGRDRANERKKGERSLDIDILLFGDTVIADGPTLIIPHEGLLERKFALLPLLELEPEARDPRSGKALAEAFAALPEQGIYYADIGPYNTSGGPDGRSR